MIKQIIPLAFLLLFSCGQSNKKNGTSANLQDDARAVCALTFANSYIKASRGDIDEWVKSCDMATESFKAEYQKLIDKGWETDPEIGLDSDPVFDGQDHPDEGYVPDSIDDKGNFVFLKGKGEEQFKLAVKVIKKNGKWFVDGSGIVNIPQSIQKKIRP